VIALGTPRELIAGLGAQHVVEFRVGGADAPALDEPALLALDGAVSVRRRNGSYLLESRLAHRTVPALLVWLAARDLPLDELTTHSATLEDVFVHLTGRHLRDG
jgi:ABC-2 type transport system ATP-binding protein